jgi:prepilin peptidase CpaA
LLVGLVLASLPQGLGLWHALMGMGVGLVVGLPFFILRLLGAGDVKLVAVVGAFVGLPGVLWVALISGLVGGILAFALSAKHGTLSQLGGHLRSSFNRLHFALVHGQRPERLVSEAMRLPFAVAVAVASFVVLYLQHA